MTDEDIARINAEHLISTPLEPADLILEEHRASNTGENVLFSLLEPRVPAAQTA